MLFFTAFVLNLFWEFGQSGLYQSYPDFVPYWLCLIFAAVIDAILVVVILWFAQKFKHQYGIMVLTGLFIALTIELLVLNLNWWSYSPSMPLVLGIGISPLLQMMLLPLLAFYLQKKFKIYELR